MNNKLWLFIGRMNPPHLWHTSIIDKMIKENDFVMIFVGTMENRDQKNPLDYKQIKTILSKKYLFNNKLKIGELKDDSSDLVWVYSIYKLLYENYPWITDINLYLWDFVNDSAYKTIKKNENHFPNISFNYIQQSRQDSFVLHEWNKLHISSTNLRKAIRDNDNDLVHKLCDKDMFNEIKTQKFTF